VTSCFYNPVGHNRGRKAAGPSQGAVRGTVNPYSSHIIPVMTAQDMTIASQMGQMIADGLAKLRVLRQNPPIGSAPPRANRVRDKATQRVASRWHFLGVQ
jgi:hypothetical protein